MIGYAVEWPQSFLVEVEPGKAREEGASDLVTALFEGAVATDSDASLLPIDVAFLAICPRSLFDQFKLF